MRQHTSPFLVAGFAAALLVFAFHPAWGANHMVVTQDPHSFSPSALTIAAGDTVTFSNTAQGFHDVHADDNSFRCANGCDGDGHGGNGDPSTNLWTFQLTFSQPGTVSYHCEIHGSMGMVGSITVMAAGSAGSLGFSAATYSVSEKGGSAPITVHRTGGATGAVSVHYATSNGSAIAGTHYRSTSGTLNWVDGDSAGKSFSVQVLDDGVADGTHTVNLSLSSPAGGASLGTSSAALAITDADAGAGAGTLQLSSAAFSVSEKGGSAPISVTRSHGSAGAVSVHYATSGGTAVAGTNYTSTSGTLNWADGDAAAKTFNVAVLDDGVVDGSHTVNLALSSPTGGAALGTASAVLTITDADGGTGGPPAAPTGLTATAMDTTSIQLSWHSGSGSVSNFRVQSKQLDGSAFQDVSPLVPGGMTSVTISGLQPATGYGFRVRAENGSGTSAFTSEADVATDAVPAPCVADSGTLCLGAGGRFKASVAFVNGGSPSAGANAIPLATNPDSGLFYFFGPSNIEMLIKVLNACAPPFNHYWVFFAATTNVQFTVTVVDTVSGKVQVYFNPLNQPAVPVQDTSAFATCP
jgi:plastocyanin